MKNCTSCNEILADSATTCFSCGKEQPKNYRCRECGEPIENLFDKCRKCGGEAESIAPYVKPTKLEYSTYAKIWFVFCIICNFVFLINRNLEVTGGDFTRVGISLLYIWLLLFKEWTAFRMIIIYWVLIILLGFFNHYFWIHPLWGILNSFITYLFIRKHWYEM